MKLSADEFAQVPDARTERRQHHETFLYEHLMAARRERAAMERAASCGEFTQHDGARMRALTQAREHYRVLLNMGGAFDSLLAQMAHAEGLTP